MPNKQILRKSINKKMRDFKFRTMAVKAVDIFQKNNPIIYINLDDRQQIEMRFMDVYCQAYREHLIAFEDLVLTAMAWQNVLSGNLIYRFLQVRENPYPDKQIDANQDILKDMVKQYQKRNLYDILDADFWGGNQGEDGFIEFKKPFIESFSAVGYDAEGDRTEASDVVDGVCSNFPLEVGYCMPDQMEFHLRTRRCVARFPYGYDFVIFIESKRDDVFNF
ncbi:hypothetical protein [Thiomicrorhabdus chilensis]|uniref:hypothetical protein n=1 Tax=Thiomicrorhabdus chilensis TaxID=63656 RepID=UPI00041DD9C4|nr:hypothetical protein [Thiomicrorhabdus chilensis]